MTPFYRPERPSVWRDLRSIPFAPATGLPMLAAFGVVFVFALILEVCCA